jgi:hypothetical protein
MSKVKSISKVESVEEYLARGGSIKRIPEASRDPVPDVVRKTVNGGPAVFLSLDEADLFYGEAKKNAKPKKSKPSLKIDLNALPPALRSKFIAKLKEEVDGEDYQEEFEEIESDLEEDED